MSARMRDIKRVAADLGLGARDIEIHGSHRAKVRLRALETAPSARGRYVLVTAITPTPAGEGKTVTALGLSMGLAKLGHTTSVNLRQSSLGPTLGYKGGGAGGGAARIEPFEDALVGLGADFFAVESANNLLAAFVDDAIYRGSIPFDLESIGWKRALDIDDRALRHITIDGNQHYDARATGFDITAASEIMGIMAMARDLADLRKRLGRIVVGFDTDGNPVTAERLRCAGAMAALLRDALSPNLMQTSEGTPAFIHTGPFGNVGPGCSSVVADRIALPRAEYVVTEAGFGADIGGEKFFDLKCAASGEHPDAVVMVASVRSVKAHSGRYDVRSGHALPPELDEENVAAVEEGMANLRKQLSNVQQFGIPVVVVINRFPSDTSAEVKTVHEAALAAGAVGATEHFAFERGGEGCIEFAEAVRDACELGTDFHPLYRAEDSARAKVERIATTMYGAKDVAWSEQAVESLKRFEHAGYADLPLCMAKTHLSLSHDPTVLGAPTGFTLPIRDVRLAAGAGWLLVLTGSIVTMPGMPSDPRAAHMDIAPDGHILGLL
ncbi:MAG: formate--tetrahydrofolate ligase [Actinomycetota bacterium]